MVKTASVRAADAVRRTLRDADMVLVDATDDDVQAIDVFTHGVASLGPTRAAVYTERMHEGLEYFVRAQGALLLLGPLSDGQWKDYFRTALDTQRPEQRWGKAA